MKNLPFVLLLGFGLLLFSGLARWRTVADQSLLMTDAQGYYAYLPAVFIYHDLQFNFIDSVNEKYYPPDKRARFRTHTPDGVVNKYFAGTAVMQFPFFMAAVAVSALTDAPKDGYSWPFQWMVGMAAWFYLLAGLWLLGKALLGSGFNRKAVRMTLLLMLFGTDLFYYSVYEPGMSHVYSLFCVSAFIYCVQMAVVKERVGHWVGASLALGLAVLVRPVNGLIVLSVPMVASGTLAAITALETLFRKRKVLMWAVLAFAALLAVQPVIYMLQTGHALVWSYAGEGFNFMSPRIADVLFSYRRGLFVYAPVLLLAVLGAVAGLSKQPARYAWLLVFLSMVIWVISSWWMWYYGGAFGHRAFIEYLPFFAFGMAFALQYGWGIARPWLFYAAGVVLIALQLVQTYQYVEHILPFDNITKEKYWNLFLLTGDDIAWYYQGYDGQDSYEAIDSVLVKHDMEEPLGWGGEDKITEEYAFDGLRSSKMSSDDEYGITYKRRVADIPTNVNLVRVSCRVLSDSMTTDLSIVCSLQDSSDIGYYWKNRPVRPQFDGRNNWAWVTALFRCGTPRDSTDSFLIYPLKSDGATVYFDDVEISFIHAK